MQVQANLAGITAISDQRAKLGQEVVEKRSILNQLEVQVRLNYDNVVARLVGVNACTGCDVLRNWRRLFGVGFFCWMPT